MANNFFLLVLPLLTFKDTIFLIFFFSFLDLLASLLSTGSTLQIITALCLNFIYMATEPTNISYWTLRYFGFITLVGTQILNFPTNWFWSITLLCVTLPSVELLCGASPRIFGCSTGLKEAKHLFNNETFIIDP